MDVVLAFGEGGEEGVEGGVAHFDVVVGVLVATVTLKIGVGRVVTVSTTNSGDA